MPNLEKELPKSMQRQSKNYRPEEIQMMYKKTKKNNLNSKNKSKAKKKAVKKETKVTGKIINVKDEYLEKENELPKALREKAETNELINENELPKAFQNEKKEEKKKEEINVEKLIKKRRKKSKKNKIWIRILVTLIILGIMGMTALGFLLYGPYSGFRDWLITSAMTTMSHQYLATWFYDEDTINSVLNNNKVEDTNEITDTSLTVIVKKDQQLENEIKYANEYERQILEKDPNNDDYKIIEISGKGYSGYLAAIYDPSRVKTVYSKSIGSSGQYLTTMAKENDALIAINGGGFEDAGGKSNGSTPVGITFSGGKLITSKSYSGQGGLIGFSKENKLVVGKMTVAKAKELNIRDAVTFGPFLIINGKAVNVSGNGGWGTAPRTAIGQRQDGIVLFLVVDGRTVTRPGATINDLIEIMQRYGAYNAANLDGGTSTAMVVNNEVINDPVDRSGTHRTRYISTAFILTKKAE